jgi:hypothetical protein
MTTRATPRLAPVVTLTLALALVLALPPRVPAADCLVLDDFSRGKLGEFPPDWKPRKESGRPVYALAEEGPLRFLRAISKGIGIQAARQREWDPKEYPFLTWRWRPVQFPPGSDERQSKTNDSAVSVYAVFPHSPISVKSLKYVWSRVAPVGPAPDSSGGLTKVQVLRSGQEGLGEWREERVNVLEDYRRRFEVSEVPKAAGISVLTDADDTKSEARGDYAGFGLCRP